MTSFQNSISTYRPTGTAQRTVGLLLAAALNAGIVYALLANLGMVPMPVIPPPFNGSVIIETRDIDLPPPPQPVIPQPQINPIIPPIIEVPLEPEGSRNTITVPEPPPATPPQSEPQKQASIERPVPPPVIVTPARAIMSTHTIPDYPPVSRRLAEQGTLRLRLAIGVNGAVEDAQIEASSGYKRLDDAAVQWVKAHWRYEPAMQGAKPVASTATAQVTFALK